MCCMYACARILRQCSHVGRASWWCSCKYLLQDAVRGDHGEVAQLLINHGGKIFKTAESRLVDLNRSHLAG